MHTNVHSISPCFEPSSIRQWFPIVIVLWSCFNKLHILTQSFELQPISDLFHTFKDLSWDWTCRPSNIHSSLIKKVLDTTECTHVKCVTLLNSAEWAVLVVSLVTCLMHQARKGGPAATCAQPRWVHVEDWKYSWTCLQFLGLVCQERCSIAQLICTLAPAACKPMLNSAAWDMPQAPYSSISFAAVIQWFS